MKREFDIFEKFSDGSTVWRECVSGQFEARRKVQELSEVSENAFFAIDIQDASRLPLPLLRGHKRQQIANSARRAR